MSKSRKLVANLGSAKGGLSTVGYTIYNEAGSVEKARSTSGVTELGTSTGIYKATVTLDDAFDGFIVWDSGDATVRYAVEPTLGQLNSIQDGTDYIRIIWNSMRNQGESIVKLLTLLKDLKSQPTPKYPEYSKELKKINSSIDDLYSKKYPDLKDISAVLKVAVNAIKIETPKIDFPKIPDYSEKLINLIKLTNSIAQEIALVPKQQKDYTSDLMAIVDKFDSFAGQLEQKLSVLAKDADVKLKTDALQALLDKIKKDIADSKANIEQSIVDNTKLDKVVKDMIIAQQAIKVIDNSNAQKNNIDNLRLGLGLGR